MQHARRLFFALASCIAFAGCGAGDEPAPAEHGVERIVLVTIDTLRADHVGCYGAELAETPALDALAAEGARFETAISPAAITLPSHTTLLTGRDPPQHGVRHNGFFRLPPDVVPLAEHLRGAGFASAAFVSAFGDSRSASIGFDPTTQLGMLRQGRPGAVRSRAATVRSTQRSLAGHCARALFPGASLRRTRVLAAAVRRALLGCLRREVAFIVRSSHAARGDRERWPAGAHLCWVTSDHCESIGEHGEGRTPMRTRNPARAALAPGRACRGKVVAAWYTRRRPAAARAGVASAAAAPAESPRGGARGTGESRGSPLGRTLETQLAWPGARARRRRRSTYVRAPTRALLPQQTRASSPIARPRNRSGGELDASSTSSAAGPSCRASGSMPRRRALEALAYLRRREPPPGRVLASSGPRS